MYKTINDINDKKVRKKIDNIIKEEEEKHGRYVNALNALTAQLCSTIEGAQSFYIKSMQKSHDKVLAMAEDFMTDVLDEVNKINRAYSSTVAELLEIEYRKRSDIDKKIEAEIKGVLKIESKVIDNYIEKNLIEPDVSQKEDEVKHVFTKREKTKEEIEMEWGAHFSRKGMDGATWKNAMRKKFGKKIKKDLNGLYKWSKHYIADVAEKTGAIKQGQKKIKDVIMKHYRESTGKTPSINELSLKLQNEGLTKAEADSIATETHSNFSLLSEVKRDRIEKIVRMHKITKSQVVKSSDLKFINILIELSNLGALSDNNYWDTIKEKLELPSLDAKVTAELEKYVEKINKAPEGSYKNDAAMELQAYIHDKTGGNTIGKEVFLWYASLLSGTTPAKHGLTESFRPSIFHRLLRKR